jgi:hypothetical protein
MGPVHQPTVTVYPYFPYGKISNQEQWIHHQVVCMNMDHVFVFDAALNACLSMIFPISPFTFDFFTSAAVI